MATSMTSTPTPGFTILVSMAALGVAALLLWRRARV
jgi:PGF-CTERM protein